MTLQCPCCCGQIEVSSYRDEPTRSQHVVLRHPRRRVARPSKVSPQWSNTPPQWSEAPEKAPIPHAETAEFTGSFCIDDRLSLHALGAYSELMLSEAVKGFGARCFEALQGSTTPAPKPTPQLTSGFGKDTRRIIA